jgi:hypothetical protein
LLPILIRGLIRTTEVESAAGNLGVVFIAIQPWGAEFQTTLMTWSQSCQRRSLVRAHALNVGGGSIMSRMTQEYPIVGDPDLKSTQELYRCKLAALDGDIG